MTKYICNELETVKNIYGGYDCKSWQELQTPTPLLPELTQEQANEITLAIIAIMVVVWGWQMAIKLIQRS